MFDDVLSSAVFALIAAVGLACAATALQPAHHAAEHGAVIVKASVANDALPPRQVAAASASQPVVVMATVIVTGRRGDRDDDLLFAQRD